MNEYERGYREALEAAARRHHRQEGRMTRLVNTAAAVIAVWALIVWATWWVLGLLL